MQVLLHTILEQTLIGFEETGGFYNFSNVRYAASPTGNLRFRAPQTPSSNRSVVQTGNIGRICPQSIPQWIIEGTFFTANYTQGLPFNASAWQSPGISVVGLLNDPRTTEDCLFLDVVVHQKVLNSRGNRTGIGAPVLVWIHGGGYAEGSKSDYGTPGKIEAPNDEIIFVSINYRLGAFGFLSGPTLQSNGDANAGLLDQRFALEWVKKYIYKFGGDPNKVTVIGESAGGGSILQQITVSRRPMNRLLLSNLVAPFKFSRYTDVLNSQAYGGQNGRAPFSRAILQSPANYPYRSISFQEQATQDFLALLNVSTISQARNLSSAALILANEQQQAGSAYGEFVYGPVVDGSFIPDYPGRLLLNGRFDSQVDILVGHNADEGPLFTDPSIIDNASFNTFVASLFPTTNSSTTNSSLIEYVTNTLYPPIFNGSQQYTSNLERAILLNSDILITCNTFYLDTAFKNKTHAYLFAVPPALHGDDLPYTFYTGPFSPNYTSSAFNETVAATLQDFIVSFTREGKPNTTVAGVPNFTSWGPSAQLMELSTASIGMASDPTANNRCKWWELGLGWHN
jgi:carboxylesterase type B